jgi:hypothetical protein
MLDIRGNNSTKTEKEQIEIISSQIKEFKDDGNGSYIKFTFSNFKCEEDTTENPITFVFLVELPRIVIIPEANRIHRSEDTIKNWDDLASIADLIKKYEKEYEEKEE